MQAFFIVRQLEPVGWIFAALNFVFLVIAMGLGIFLVVESIPIFRSAGLGFGWDKTGGWANLLVPYR